MITSIRALNYRCLKDVKQEIGLFQILVGPNGSGKSAFMDVLAFLRTMISENLDAAISKRTQNFHDLVWGREGRAFVLGIEAAIPQQYWLRGQSLSFSRIIYEVRVHADARNDLALIKGERLTLRENGGTERLVALRDNKHAELWYETHVRRESLTNINRKGLTPGVDQNGYTSEIHRKFSLFTHLLAGERDFPASQWLQNLLSTRVRLVSLKTEELRAASPLYKSEEIELSGSYLVRFVKELHANSRKSFDAWIGHLQTCLPDLETVRTVLRPEDRHQ
jgi:predicted ATPase